MPPLLQLINPKGEKPMKHLLTQPAYCVQNYGHCETCSLSNYGHDCVNHKIIIVEKPMEKDNAGNVPPPMRPPEKPANNRRWK
jgi:hypothetical protein